MSRTGMGAGEGGGSSSTVAMQRKTENGGKEW